MVGTDFIYIAREIVLGQGLAAFGRQEGTWPQVIRQCLV